MSWEGCFNPDKEISALQHAYNALIDDGEEVFASEYQNQPIRRAMGSEDFTLLPIQDIRQRINGLPRGIAPLGTDFIVGFVDVQHTALFYKVLASKPPGFSRPALSITAAGPTPTAALLSR